MFVVNYKPYLQVSSTSEKLENIATAVIEELTAFCTECRITNDIIDKQSFTCFPIPESSTYVTYRARLEGTSEIDSNSLISLIEEWVSGGPSINVTGVQMTVDSKCSVAISSLGEGECSPTTDSTMTTTGSTLSVRVGSVVAVILFIITVIIIVMSVVLFIKICGKMSLSNDG